MGAQHTTEIAKRKEFYQQEYRSRVHSLREANRHWRSRDQRWIVIYTRLYRPQKTT